MDRSAGNKLILILLAALVIIIAAFYIPIPPSGTSGVHIIYTIGGSQGAAPDNPEIEFVRINGTLSNDGDVPAENLNISIIFNDEAHNKIITDVVKEGVYLPPRKESTVEFFSEYSRNRTVPKTEVKTIIQIEWMEKGQPKIITEELFPEVVPSNFELNGTKWSLTLMNGSSLLESTSITLEFKDGRIGGRSGCNSYGSDYTSNDSGTMAVDTIMVTLMYCTSPEGIMQQESQYLNILRNVSAYSISGGLLTLSTDDGGELVYSKIV